MTALSLELLDRPNDRVANTRLPDQRGQCINVENKFYEIEKLHIFLPSLGVVISGLSCSIFVIPFCLEVRRGGGHQV